MDFGLLIVTKSKTTIDCIVTTHTHTNKKLFFTNEWNWILLYFYRHTLVIVWKILLTGMSLRAKQITNKNDWSNHRKKRRMKNYGWCYQFQKWKEFKYHFTIIIIIIHNCYRHYYVFLSSFPLPINNCFRKLRLQ